MGLKKEKSIMLNFIVYTSFSNKKKFYNLSNTLNSKESGQRRQLLFGLCLTDLPEVRDGVRQRALGGDVGGHPGVMFNLKEVKQNKDAGNSQKVLICRVKREVRLTMVLAFM